MGKQKGHNRIPEYLPRFRLVQADNETVASKFRDGDLSWHDEYHPKRSHIILGRVLKKLLDTHPLASTKVISRHFDISPAAVKEILRRDLGLKRYIRRWVTHELSEDRKKYQVHQSGTLLDMLRLYAELGVEG
jgi:hypothetical protein